MKKITKLIFGVVLLLPIFSFAPAKADLAFPSKTTFYFQQNGKPYNNPVEFKVDCYGYRYNGPYYLAKVPEKGTYTPELLISYPDNGSQYSCSGYGCVMDGTNYFSTKAGRIDYCNFTGSTQGKTFAINNKEVSNANNCKMESGKEFEECSITLELGNQITPNSQKNTNTQTKNGVNNNTDADTKYKIEDVNLPNSISDIGIPTKKASNPTIIFLWALLITVTFETLILIALIKILFKKEFKDTKIGIIIGAGVLASLTTLPYLWLVAPEITRASWGSIIVGETLVILAEGLIYKLILKKSWGASFLLSLICNLASFLLGLLIM